MIKMASNQAASVDAPIAILFAFVRLWRRATDQRRSAAAAPMKFVIFSFAVLLLASCDPMPTTTTVKSERKSPDGKLVATAFLTDAGATTSWSPQVDLRPVGERMNRHGNVFVGYGSPNIDTEWLSSSQLVVYFDTNYEVNSFVTNWRGITIEIKHLK
jgi:hypothetical protein